MTSQSDLKKPGTEKLKRIAASHHDDWVNQNQEVAEEMLSDIANDEVLLDILIAYDKLYQQEDFAYDQDSDFYDDLVEVVRSVADLAEERGRQIMEEHVKQAQLANGES